MTKAKNIVFASVLHDAMDSVARLSRSSAASVPGADRASFANLIDAAETFLVRTVPIYTGHSFGDMVVCKDAGGRSQLAVLDSWTVDETGAPMLDMAIVDRDLKSTGKRIQIYFEDCPGRITAKPPFGMEETPEEPEEAPAPGG